MRILSTGVLEKLTKDELWEVLTDRRNSDNVRQVALERWLEIDSQDYSESIGRMRRLIAEARKRLSNSDQEEATEGKK